MATWAELLLSMLRFSPVSPAMLICAADEASTDRLPSMTSPWAISSEEADDKSMSLIEGELTWMVTFDEPFMFVFGFMPAESFPDVTVMSNMSDRLSGVSTRIAVFGD